MKTPQMTGPMLLVLNALARDPGKQRYGLDLSQETGLKPGTIYPVLARLERYEWVASAWEEIDPHAAGRRPRRYYQLTPAGQFAASRHLARFRKA
jgi:DNA-binding PadR family transcriptional regulator